ncbi:hypothetical protein [Flavihumibacter sp. CACIAM 22H1]|uniref:hypothetical protein n=1 Tax=Flavihumibacter sp. CACIAM 22H1 TaxID=1812911 RepID=UPI0007A8C945|nr:hypothetical protein [Flavihumibacter sp. CACIAM 22H1]KYP13082.1 MAG: hypothetical protein A1D16_01415 [Flavihumibacter sp. CACIAM 22H1]
MEKKRPEIDIVNEVLEACIMAYPVSSFVISLYKQYLQRGSLSKKQLQGLYGKASRIEDLPAGKLATLEALIARMPTRLKSSLPAIDQQAVFERDPEAGKLIAAILSRYPEHKRVLFLQGKYLRNEPLLPADIADLKRFARVLGV